MGDEHEDALLTTGEVSKWLAIPSRTLCLWAETDEIPAIKIGRHWRFSKASIQLWLRDKESAKWIKLRL